MSQDVARCRKMSQDGKREVIRINAKDLTATAYELISLWLTERRKMLTTKNDFSILSFLRNVSGQIFVKYIMNDLKHDEDSAMFFKLEMLKNGSVLGRYATQQPRNICKWKPNKIFIKSEEIKLEKIKFNLLVKKVERKDGSGSFLSYVALTNGKWHNVKFRKCVENKPNETGYYLVEISSQNINYVEDKYPVIWIRDNFELVKKYEHKVVEDLASKSQNDLPY